MLEIHRRYSIFSVGKSKRKRRSMKKKMCYICNRFHQFSTHFKTFDLYTEGKEKINP